MEGIIGGQSENPVIQESQQNKNLSIGERIAIARELNRWTLNQLAQKVNSTGMKLSRIERGSEPGATLAGNIAKATGFKFEFFDVNNHFAEKDFLLHHLKNVCADFERLNWSVCRTSSSRTSHSSASADIERLIKEGDVQRAKGILTALTILRNVLLETKS